MSSDTIKTYRQKRKSELIYIMGGKCQICGYDKCETALEFHHCNPEEKKFSFSNGNCRSLERDLQEARKCTLLCANCHREVEYKKIKLSSSFNEEKANEIIQKHNFKTSFCVDCGIQITSNACRCRECAQKFRRKVQRPSREELKKLVREKSMLEVGRIFNVSDNAIRKWCINENIPSRKKDILSFTDEDWEKI